MILATDWVVIGNNRIKCKRCLKDAPLPLPLDLTEFVRWTTDWSNKHLKCRQTAIPRNGFPVGIGWWWDVASTWDENQFETWLRIQSRARLVQMLQETDPNGSWADEQAKSEIGNVTPIQTAQKQMRIFWRESVPYKNEEKECPPSSK